MFTYCLQKYREFPLKLSVLIRVQLILHSVDISILRKKFPHIVLVVSVDHERQARLKRFLPVNLVPEPVQINFIAELIVDNFPSEGTADRILKTVSLSPQQRHVPSK